MQLLHGSNFPDLATKTNNTPALRKARKAVIIGEITKRMGKRPSHIQRTNPAFSGWTAVISVQSVLSEPGKRGLLTLSSVKPGHSASSTCSVTVNAFWTHLTESRALAPSTPAEPPTPVCRRSDFPMSRSFAPSVCR